MGWGMFIGAGIVAGVIVVVLTWLYSITGLKAKAEAWIDQEKRKFQRGRLRQARFPVGTPVKYVKGDVGPYYIGKVREIQVTSFGGVRYRIGSNLIFKEAELQADMTRPVKIMQDNE